MAGLFERRKKSNGKMVMGNLPSLLVIKISATFETSAKLPKGSLALYSNMNSEVFAEERLGTFITYGTELLQFPFSATPHHFSCRCAYRCGQQTRH